MSMLACSEYRQLALGGRAVVTARWVADRPEKGWTVSGVFSAALVGGLIGTFFGGFTKFLWEKWLPEWLTWKRAQRVERERQLAYVRAPAILAFSDLHFRLLVIEQSQAGNYHYVKRLGQADYYIHSTAYLVARVFAWQEILRRRMASYDYAELYQLLEGMTRAFSRGYPGFQVWRLEQTEIGERMIVAGDDDDVACLSLSDFLDLLEQEDVPRWLSSLRERVTALLDDPANELRRVVRVDESLIKLLAFLDPKRRWRPEEASVAISAQAVVAGWVAADLLESEDAERLVARMTENQAPAREPEPPRG
jgi:hypothetical protein